MNIDGIINSPSLMRVKTIDQKTHYLNSNMVVAYSPSEDDENKTDIVMLNGQKFTVYDSVSQIVDARYSRDVRNGTSIFNLLA